MRVAATAPLILSGLIFASFSRPYTAAAQESLIASVNRSRGSLVEIIAENANLFRSPGSKAVIDRETGRLVVMRNIQSAVHKRFGAGVILSPDGYIATNAHTVYKADRILVKLNDGTVLPADALKLFPDDDLSLLKVRVSRSLDPISLSDSSTLRLGDEVVTVGNSELLKRTISGGKVIGLGSSRSRKGQDPGDDTEIIQTNITLYKGDSGGPLLDSKGRLIGMMVAGQVQRRRSSFAVPSNRIYQHYVTYRKQEEKPSSP